MKKTMTFIGATLLGMTLSFGADCKKCDKAATVAKAECDGGKCEKECDAKLETAFSKHDEDKDGKLTLVEFKALVKAMKAECAEECEEACDGGKCDKAEKTVKAEKAKTAAVTK